jgi:hypothetical protein
MYLLLALWGDGSNPIVYQAFCLHSGIVGRFKLDKKRKTRFKRIA